MNRQSQAESERFKSLNDKIIYIHEELRAYKANMVEEVSMTKEDFYTRLATLDKKISKTKSVVSKCKESNDILLDKIDDYREHLLNVEKSTIIIDE
jgi:hypothetical protein